MQRGFHSVCGKHPPHLPGIFFASQRTCLSASFPVFPRDGPSEVPFSRWWQQQGMLRADTAAPREGGLSPSRLLQDKLLLSARYLQPGVGLSDAPFSSEGAGGSSLGTHKGRVGGGGDGSLPCTEPLFKCPPLPRTIPALPHIPPVSLFPSQGRHSGHS